MMMKLLERIAYILILLAAGLYLFLKWLAPWLMIAGGLGVTACHLNEKYGGTNLRQKRNMRLRYMLGLFYMVSGYFMFKPGMDWLPFLCVAVLLELYTLFVISKREKGE